MSNDELPDFTQPVSWRRRALLSALVVVALVAVAGAVVWLPPRLACGGLFSGVHRVAGECVGVTDGSYVFHPRFRAIQEKIKKENDWVAARAKAKGKPYVKVALLTTLTPTEDSPLSPERVLSSLEGAYVALRRANRTHEFKDPEPLIQLHLANEGSRQAQWETAVQQIEDMTGDEAPLVGVVGQGVSSDRTKAAALRLSRSGIPMVSGVVTADGLDHAHIPGLLRASPSNVDYVTALRRHLNQRPDLKTAIMVYDNTEPDLYVTTLRKAYERKLGKYLKLAHQPFRGITFGQQAHSVFSTITTNICSAEPEPDMVLYAGRAHDLLGFVEALSNRTCREQPLTILYAVTGLLIESESATARHLKEGNLTITLAAAAHPGWARGTVKPPEHFEQFQGHFQELISRDPAALDNGYAVMYHDALATAVSAIRLTATRWDDPVVPRPEDVRDQLLLLNGAHKVPGASGTLSFTENRGGNPGGKHVPIVVLPYDPRSDAKAGDPYITPDH
ncbi:MAG: ABC transporter substrate-binding protein [Micromonosporaceae bacterium]